MKTSLRSSRQRYRSFVRDDKARTLDDRGRIGGLRQAASRREQVEEARQ